MQYQRAVAVVLNLLTSDKFWKKRRSWCDGKFLERFYLFCIEFCVKTCWIQKDFFFEFDHLSLVYLILIYLWNMYWKIWIYNSFFDEKKLYAVLFFVRNVYKCETLRLYFGINLSEFWLKTFTWLRNWLQKLWLI